MGTYRVVLSRTAEKELRVLPTNVVRRIVPALQSLSDNPRPSGCKKLKGFDDLWRIRIGDYRAIYAIKDVITLVDVRAIGHRRDIYD